MDLLPTRVSEYNKPWTGARFTVRSAKSPSYILSRGSRVGERERYGTSGTNKREDKIAGYQTKTGSCSSVKSEMKETSTKLNQNGTTDKTITEFGTDKSENPAFESHGRTERRSRNMNLDLRVGERSPDFSTRTDISMLSTKGEKQPGEWEERWTGVENVRGQVMSSIQASAGASNAVQERPVSHMSHTLDRVSKGYSLPSRLRSQSASRFTETSSGPKGGQSILERIEKLYGSAGFGKDFSTPETTTDSLISPQQKSCKWAEGGTFPRRFSSGERNSLSPVKTLTWIPQEDTSGSDIPLSVERSRRLSGGQWQEQIKGRYSEAAGVTWGKGLEEIGTKSLDRARSRCTVAAQIRSARAAEGITAHPEANTFLEERSLSFKNSSGLRERRASGSKDWNRTNHRKENELKCSSTDEDVFESNSQKIMLKTAEKNRSPKMLSVPSVASVRNKIIQFEALSQRAQVLVPRRALSVPTQLGVLHDGVKVSESAKATGRLRDKWKEETGDESGEKVREAGKKLWSERSVSVDGVGLRLGWKDREGKDLTENERTEMDSGNNCGDDFGKYSKLKSTLKIPLNEGAQRQCGSFHIDETDFSKVSSPEEANKRNMTDNNMLSLPLSSNTADGVQKTTSSGVTSPVSDDDKTPTNTPSNSPFLSPLTQLENVTPIANTYDSTSVKTPDPDSPPLLHPLATSSHSKLPDVISSDVSTAYPKGKKQAMDLDAWLAGLNSDIKFWNNDEDDYEDDDESTQKDEDSNYDSDSGESSVTITSNTFCVSLSDLCNIAGVDYKSENDRDDWQSTGRRSLSVSSDVSALSCVSVMPSEELDRLLQDVRSLGDDILQDYDDVRVVVLHKEMGVGLGFSVAGGVDQNKPVTVHKVFHSGIAAQEGSIREGDQVLSINGTALCGYAHWEALRVLRRAKSREMGVVVLRREDVSGPSKRGVQGNNQGPTQTQFAETGQHMCVRLEKNSRDLGFTLEGGAGSNLGNKPLTVQKIFQGGPVDKVFPGDEVLEIGGVSTVGMSRLEAWTLIRKLPPGLVDVVIRRLKHLET